MGAYDSDRAWAWAMAGTGPRRWASLGASSLDPQRALAVASGAVAARRSFRLAESATPSSAAAILTQLDADLQAGWAVAGYWSYELGAALERAEFGPGPLADAEWICFDPKDLKEVLLPDTPKRVASEPPPIPADLARQEQAYLRSAAEVLEKINAGQVYQVNLTAEVTQPFAGWPDALTALAAVQNVQPVPFAAVFQGSAQMLICGSMERFLSVAGRQVCSRPIKGTAPRHPLADMDASIAQMLQQAPKERAENIMIVDMVRNDLQRAAVQGSVQVAELLEAVAYTTLWHLESEVTATLAESGKLGPLLQATMPPASVTGCPKIQAMHVIAQLEQRCRGPYCGALGIAFPDGSADLAVAIRTLWLDGECARFGVGAGLVADSVPAAEWAETCLKARSPLAILDLLRGSP